MVVNLRWRKYYDKKNKDEIIHETFKDEWVKDPTGSSGIT